MKKYITVFFVLLISSVLEKSFFYELFGVAGNPTITLSLAFAFLLLGNIRLAFFSAFCGGLFIDFFDMRIIGFTAFIYVLLIFILSFLYMRFIKNIPTMLVIFCLLLILMKSLIYNYSFWNIYILIGSILSVVYASVCYLALRRGLKRYTAYE